MVTSVVTATTSPIPKSIYGSFLKIIREYWISEYFWVNHMYLVCLWSVCMYSFIVSSRWGLNCGFNAPSVMPQGSWIWVLIRLQRINNYFVTAWGIEFSHYWLAYLHPCCVKVDEYTRLGHPRKESSSVPSTAPQVLWSSWCVTTIIRRWKVFCPNMDLGVTFDI